MFNKLKAIVDNMQLRWHGNKRRWKRQKTPNCDYISELFINSLSLPAPKETRIMRRKRSEIYHEATPLPYCELLPKAGEYRSDI